MPGWLAGVGQAAAGTAATGAVAMGLQRLGANYDRKQQLKTAEQMMALQMKGERAMMESQRQIEMQMWQDTGPTAQMEQLTKAGLNPGLIYGMGGAGGQSIGHGGSPAVTGQQAPYVDTAGMGIQRGMEMALQQAQIELMKSQAKKTDVEANKIGGVDTTKTNTEIQSLTQGIENQKAIEQLTKIQTQNAEIENDIKGATQNAAKALIMQAVRTSYEQMEIIKNEGAISDATMDEKIKIVEQELAGAYVKNELTRAQTGKTKADTEQLQKSITLAYDQLKNEQDKTAIQKKLQEFETSFGGQASNILRGLLDLIPGKKILIKK